MQLSEYLYVPLATWALAQAVKFFIAMLKGQYQPSLLFSSGGMPSVHSATVSSLAMVALIEGGPASPLFGITGIFAAIVMYDSLGVRRAAGEQAKTLNLLIGDLQRTGTLKQAGGYGHLKEILGHRPLEVMIGAVMGVVFSGLFLYQSVLTKASWLLAIPDHTAWIIELAAAGVLIVTGVGGYLAARRGRGHVFRPFLFQVMISSLAGGGGLLFVALLQNQHIAPWNNWLTVCLVLGLFITWHLALWYRLLVDGALRLPEASEATVQERQKRWFKASQTRANRRRKARKKAS